ncbi:MAG: CPBP family intramembrane metalloprotease [Anaerolineales bacterium]|nr:CPBP family intramembrane metalloprotease [Anaerolineales bacterium]
MKTLGKIGLFFVITFVFTMLLVIVQELLGIATTEISLPQFGPGLAALLMLRLFRKDRMKLTLTLKGEHPLKYAAALGIPLAVPLLLYLVYDWQVAPIHIQSMDSGMFVAMLGGILLGAFGEEVGWRGYAQKLLNRQLNGVAAFVIIGVLWGVWHIGNFQHGLLFMLFYVFSTIGYSAVMAWLLQGTDYNVILASLFHFGVNAGFYILQDALSDTRLVALNGVVWLGAAILIARKRTTLLPGPWKQTESRLEPSHQGAA